MADVQVEDVGPCKKLLKVRVPQEQVRAKVDESFEQLRQTVSVPGFRQGRTPRKLLEKRFGEQVTEDVKQTLMADASSEAFQEANLKPLGEPSFDSAEFNTDQDFTFDVTVEVEPEFELPEYKGLELTRPSEEVTEEEVEQAVTSILRRLGTLEEVENAKIQLHDVITCDWQVAVETEEGTETPLGNQDEQFELREGVFSAIGAVDVAGQLAGAGKGDTVEIPVALPEDHPVEKLQGKQGTLRIDIKDIRRPNIPELTEEVARRLDFDSPDELRESVKAQVTAGKARQAREQLERQAEEALLAKADLQLPEGVLKRQSRHNLDRQQMRLRMRGFPDEEIDKRIDELRVASESAAERDFKLYFLMNRIADQEKIYVTENEVENAISRLASAYRTSAHRMRQDLEQNERIEDLRLQMRMDKVRDFLIQNANIRETSG